LADVSATVIRDTAYSAELTKLIEFASTRPKCLSELLSAATTLATRISAT